MSNQIHAFIDHVKTHESLRKALLALSENENIADKVVAIAAEAGFSFSVAEYNALAQHNSNEQLSEEELENIAAGGCSPLLENILRFN